MDLTPNPINGNLYPGVPLLDATALAALSSFLLSIIKPFVEQLPGARVTSPTHDAVIRLLNVVINLGLVLALVATAGSLSLHDWPTYLVTAIGQSVGSQALYSMATRSGGSIGGPGATTTIPKPSTPTSPGGAA